MKVKMEAYNPEWKLRFLEIREQLREILKDVGIVSIEHVGSTSIPGLKAKPVLDIDIIIPASSLEAARTALTEARYTDCGEMNVPGRFVMRQPGYGRFEAAHGPGRNGELRHNTYLMIDGCLSLRNHLDVRRVLMEDDKMREEYGRFKNELAETEFEKMDHYTWAKNDILCKILRAAGWTQDDLEPVLKANSVDWRLPSADNTVIRESIES